ncbi:uncharacterized protein FIBRA_05440 [Fibroporia radiculosa]|uniref:Uncharacterized protein n=1 Tax=Fibroporia radiculosa TaxID=599839 RepID=J4HXI8_9APHY|nr:uncharacterized protein FIBRA_05440 [Fibroporia radiculosa]CCM03312.1 predicted protein [Fibroporia radiculosa]
MNDERIHRVVHIETTKPLGDIQGTFSQCGKILGIYPTNTQGTSISATYFIEFAEEGCVKRARALQVSDIKLQIVVFSQQLTATFNSIIQPPIPTAPQANQQIKEEAREHVSVPQKRQYDYHRSRSVNTQKGHRPPTFVHCGGLSPSRLTRLHPDSYSHRTQFKAERLDNEKENAFKRPKYRSYRRSLSPILPMDRVASSFLESSTLASTSSLPRNAFELSPRLSTDELPDTPHSICIPRALEPDRMILNIPPSAQSKSQIDASFPSTPPHAAAQSCLLPVESKHDAPYAMRPWERLPALAAASSSLSNKTPDGSSDRTLCAPSTETRTFILPQSISPSIILTFQGERVNCELNALEDDPEGIIAVLKATAARSGERDKWMIVAGHYRSRGNISAALAVVEAMIDVMTSTSVGLHPFELKPAFLMLACGYRDLALQARRRDGTEDEPTQESQSYTQRATLMIQRVYGTDIPQADTTSALHDEATKSSIDVSAIPSAAEGDHRQCLTSTTNLTSAHTEQGNSSCPPAESLEREIQTLRELQKEHILTRTAKRKLGDELHAERQIRQRLERELEDASRKLASSRRMENAAVDQCKAEMASRRRAEERAEEERCTRKDVEDEVRRVRRDAQETREGARRAMREIQGRLEKAQTNEKRARECFETLGLLFMKAAKGDMDDGAWKGALAGKA